MIGRGSTADMTLNDITVSRNHCVISYNSMDGGFYLSDEGSKFGTQLELKEVNHLLNLETLHKRCYIANRQDYSYA